MTPFLLVLRTYIRAFVRLSSLCSVAVLYCIVLLYWCLLNEDILQRAASCDICPNSESFFISKMDCIHKMHKTQD